jgi:hypothetical protein
VKHDGVVGANDAAARGAARPEALTQRLLRAAIPFLLGCALGLALAERYLP